LLSLKSYRYLVYILTVSLLLTETGCRVTKNFNEGESLLQYNQVKFVNEQNKEERQKSWEDLLHVAAQQPNKKVFGFIPFKLWLYTVANTKNETKTRWWIKNKVGEAPVIYDSMQVDKSDKLMATYLQNYGYFYAQVAHQVKTRKKKTIVTYKVKRGQLWKIGDVTYPSAPFLTDTIAQQHKRSSLLHRGDRFDVTALKAERDKIDGDMKNAGFYAFSREYVVYDLDTNKQSGLVNINIRINQPTDSIQHQLYWINDIYIISDYGTDLTDGQIRRDTLTIGEYHFISAKKVIKPNALLDALFLKRGQLYSKENYTKSVKTLANLGAFKFVSIDYMRLPGRENSLNCIISLTPGKKQSVSGEIQANISQDGYFGVAGLLGYKNRNLTKRSDLFTVDFTPGVQFQFSKNEPIKIITKDFSASSSYYFNKILLPFSKKLNLALKDKAPKTRLTIRYNYEQRYDFDSVGNRTFFYTLHGFNASFGYEWNKNQYIRHIFNPFNFTLFLLPQTGAYFLKRLDANSILKNSYQEQVILGPSYSFIFTNQRTKSDKKYMYFRANLETAGNVLMLGYSLANIGKSKEQPYTIFNKDFAEYAKGEFDYRAYYRVSNHGQLAGRGYIGIAVPFGNSTSVPFTRQFSSGGPNSLRGFLIREVGPGGYLDPNHANNGNIGFFNQTGDMKLEGNIELRFDIFKWFKGALFTDFGNVWLVKKDPARSDANFAFDRFWKEFAVDGGLGLRLDFSYFVIRLDYGIALRDPSIKSSNRWYVDSKNPGRFQLAVGYPF